MNTGRLIGVILIVAGVGIAIFAGLFIAVQTSEGIFDVAGAIFSAALAFIPVALLAGFGIYLYIQGGKQAAEESEMQKQRQLLDILKSRGQVRVQDMALEMNVSADKIQSMVHQLVGLQVFSGYANWKDGVLYSSDASQLRELDKCKNCGGEIELVGKGIATCKYCGTEYFLS